MFFANPKKWCFSGEFPRRRAIPRPSGITPKNRGVKKNSEAGPGGILGLQKKIPEGQRV